MEHAHRAPARRRGEGVKEMSAPRSLRECVSVDEDEVLMWIRANMEIDEVFNPVDLGHWAEDHGYVKKEDASE